MQYLVSGFNGFIGQSMAEYADKNMSLGTGLTFLTSSDPALKYQKKNKIKLDSVYNFYNAHLKQDSFSTYIHAMSSPRSRGTLRLSDNLTALRKALKACKALRIKKFIYLSSGSVYLDSNRKKREGDLIHSINSVENDYIKSKLLAERWVQKYCNQNNISYCILRLFTFGGKNIAPRIEFALSSFVRSACVSNLIAVQNPQLKRSYLHQDDLVKSIFFSANLQKWNNVIVNIGSSEVISMAELASKVSQVTNAKIHFNKLSHTYNSLDNLYVPAKTIVHSEVNSNFISIDKIIEEMVLQYRQD